MATNLSDILCKALNECNPETKASLARDCYSQWITGMLPFEYTTIPPMRPGRPDKPELLHPTMMPKRKKAKSLGNKQALFHAVCHIELNAVDLALDIVARFGKHMPQEFTTDWLKVADDEARHFTLIQNRLIDMGSYYGSMPAHDGLWESALATASDLPARLAIVPMVLEARGLDVTPAMIDRFIKAGDNKSAEILTTIYNEEVAHVATGAKWFKYLAAKENKDEQIWFQELVQKYYKGYLKRPFNVPARSKADFPEDWYDPLVEMMNSTS